MQSHNRYSRAIHQTWTCAFVILLVLVLISANADLQGAAAASYHAGVIDLWGGGSESIALRSDGTVWTWGWDQYGMLGNGYGVTAFDTGTEYDELVPFQVLGMNGIGHLTSIAAIAGGERHNVALDFNGEVWTWGLHSFGQLGIGPLADCPSRSMDNLNCMRSTPVKIPNFTSVKTIASRGYHTLALKNDGTVWAWGYNDSGRLGDGTDTDQPSPVPVVGLTNTIHGKVIAISAGGAVSAALMEDHTLMAWGDNSYGAVGNGTTSIIGQWTPVPVSQSTGLIKVKAIATGWNHMVALAQDGTVWTWGLNDSGQLGNGLRGVNNSSSLPVQVNSLSDVVSVSAGDGSTVVLKSDGTVWAWGALRTDNACCVPYDYGPMPVQVAGIDHVTLVRARDWHVLARKSDGTVWAWGWNLRGQIGDGTRGGDKTTPVQVLFPNFSPISLFLPIIQR